MRVENKPGQDRAVDVGLELLSVEPCQGTPPLALRPPRRPFVVAELESYQATSTDVPPNIARRFLVAYHDVKESDGGVELALSPRATRSKRDILPPGKYVLTLGLTASNSDATFWKTTLTFFGVAPEQQDTLPTILTLTPPVKTSANQQAL
jgi:hypothetical protein